MIVSFHTNADSIVVHLTIQRVKEPAAKEVEPLKRLENSTREVRLKAVAPSAGGGKKITDVRVVSRGLERGFCQFALDILVA